MAEPYVDDDADLSLVQDRNVAVLGYDDQARAQALCLRDSGVDVRVGLEPGSQVWDDAESDGLRVVTPYEAFEEADLQVITSRSADPRLLAETVLPNLVTGDVVVLGAAVELAGQLPDGVDLVRIVPWADGSLVRDEYSQGRGVPLFASVLHDASGAAWDVVLAYSRAIGGTRAGVIRTTDAEYDAARRFAENTLLHGGVLSVVRTGFDSLVGSGCQPVVAYLQCIYGLKLFADDLVAGRLDPELAAARAASGASSEADPMPAAAARVRAMMGWEHPGST